MLRHGGLFPFRQFGLTVVDISHTPQSSLRFELDRELLGQGFVREPLPHALLAVVVAVLKVPIGIPLLLVATEFEYGGHFATPVSFEALVQVRGNPHQSNGARH
ncbi:MAG: hypothetical protein SH850_28365 [Planctomycetaceae bacterium]|nr:hypothetical protein [Planctomycetaceae bacterium]